MLNKVMRGLVVALALAGLFVSVRALQVHNMDPGLAPPCAVSEHWDCGAVNHSRYAVFPPRSFDEDPASKTVHIPVATFGIAGYALIAIVALFGRWWIVLQLAEIAFGAAALLSYIEAFVLQKWCIYCVWSQGLVTAILLVTIVALVVRHRERAHEN
jgi:vitamin-K-epoxide reductase (warfarin-sensitive)